MTDIMMHKLFLKIFSLICLIEECFHQIFVSSLTILCIDIICSVILSNVFCIMSHNMKLEKIKMFSVDI